MSEQDKRRNPDIFYRYSDTIERLAQDIYARRLGECLPREAIDAAERFCEAWEARKWERP